jgi:hypothetical protein
VNIDSDKDQNSFILLKKDVFSNVTEITMDILQEIEKKVVERGM